MKTRGMNMRLIIRSVALILALGTSASTWAADSGMLGIWGGAGVAPGQMTSPIMTAGTTTAPSTSAINYGKFGGGFTNNIWAVAAITNETPFPVAGTIQNLQVYFPTQPGNTSGSYDVGLVKAGSKTALVCNVATAANTCTDTNAGHAVTVAAGDLVSWFVCPSNTATCTAGNAPTAQAAPVQISATFTSTATQEGFITTSPNSNQPTTLIGYSGFMGNQTWNTATEAVVSSIMPAAGTIDQLYVGLNNTPGTNGTYTLTLFKNGSATALTCVVTSAATTCSDLTHSVSVSRSDTISISTCPSSSGNTLSCTGATGTAAPTARSGNMGARWVPTTADQAVIFSGLTAAPSTTAARYSAANGQSGPSTTESNDINVVPVAMTLGNLTEAQSTAPGGATSRAFVLRAGAGGGASQGNQSPACTVTSAATSCTDTATYSATAGQAIDISTTPTGTNAGTTWVKSSMTVTIP